jgi:hypothetical protein
VAASVAESGIADEDEYLWVPAFVPWWAQRIGEALVRLPPSSKESYGAWELIAIRAWDAGALNTGVPPKTPNVTPCGFGTGQIRFCPAQPGILDNLRNARRLPASPACR